MRQKIVVAIGMGLGAFSCIFLPYQARQDIHGNEYFWNNIGYHFIFADKDKAAFLAFFDEDAYADYVEGHVDWGSTNPYAVVMMFRVAIQLLLILLLTCVLCFLFAEKREENASDMGTEDSSTS